jgi:hypothetical protein
MKIYSRILGIITFLIALFFLGLLIYLLIFEFKDSNEKLIGLTGLIPIYVVVHFVILHRFGFDLKTEYSTKQSRSILITSTILFAILLSLIGWQISDAVKAHKLEEISKKETEELYSHLSKLRTFEKQTTAYGFEGELQTKLSTDNSLLYKLKIKSKKPFNPELVTFIIEFHDKDGFLIKTIIIEDYSRIIEDDKVYGIVSNSKTDAWEFNPEEVETIANWRLLISTK